MYKQERNSLHLLFPPPLRSLGAEAGVVRQSGFEAVVRVIVSIPLEKPLDRHVVTFLLNVQYEESVFLALSGLTKVSQPALDAACALVFPVQLTLGPEQEDVSPLSDLLFVPLIPPADASAPGRAPE